MRLKGRHLTRHEIRSASSATESLSVDEQYRAALLKSIDTYRDQILARPPSVPDEGWDDLEALQQVTLGDVMERALQKKFGRQS